MKALLVILAATLLAGCSQQTPTAAVTPAASASAAPSSLPASHSPSPTPHPSDNAAPSAPVLEVAAKAPKGSGPLFGLGLHVTEKGLRPGAQINYRVAASVTVGFTCMQGGTPTWSKPTRPASIEVAAVAGPDGIVDTDVDWTVAQTEIMACADGPPRLGNFSFDSVTVTDLIHGISAPGPGTFGQVD